MQCPCRTQWGGRAGVCGVLTPIPSRSIPEQEKRLQALWSACEKLPKANYNNIR